MSFGDEQFSRMTLSPEDGAALDALVEAGFELERVEASLRPRAARIAEILSVLDREPGSRAMTDEIDTFVEQASPLSSGPISSRAAVANQRLSDLLRGGPVVGTDSLVQDTMALIAISDRAERMKFTPEVRGTGWRRRAWDAVGVAASLLVAASVLWPVLGFAESERRRLVCSSNMGSVARALGSYASDNGDSVPVMTAGLIGPWWDVGTRRSNSANLYTLVRAGYASMCELVCPGNAYAVGTPSEQQAFDWPSVRQISFSYQVMRGNCSDRLAAGPLRVLVTDRSPVVERALARQLADPLENSLNHHGRGQNSMWTDGRVNWSKTPVLANGDNIWLPREIERALQAARSRERILTGSEVPSAKDDVFVGP